MIAKPEIPELNERSLSLLKSLVQSYIRDGQPIGSKALAERSDLELSPATVRNVMSELEACGLLTSPHTSAGRIPTKRGYRLFVDTLIRVSPLADDELGRLRERLDAPADANSSALVQTASSLLSSLTHLAGVVTVPRKTHRALSQVEFVPLGERRVLAILVVGENDVQNRILHFDRDFSPAQLKQASNYLNAQFSGRTIAEVRAAILSELSATRSSMNELMSSAIQMAGTLFAEPFEPGDGCVIAGETNLMDAAELSDLEKLRRLFEAFNEKREVLHLLDKCLSSDGVQIFIGEESGWSADVSVVGAPYTVGDEVVGVLGVIGPTRMAYERVIPIVDATARILGAALNSRS